uniref:Uncharacterized protein n=1 Tax=Acrobeloides nanus TaxID=290746 RepID=A0A914DWX5_9BILA
MGYLNNIYEFEIDPPYRSSASSSSSAENSPRLLSPVSRPGSARPYRRRRKLTRAIGIEEDPDFNWDSEYCKNITPISENGDKENCNGTSVGSVQGSNSIANYSSGSTSPIVTSRQPRTGRLAQCHQKMRSFNIDSQGKIIDRGFRTNSTMKSLSPGNRKNRRSTCPEIWLSAEDDQHGVVKCILRIYGSDTVGKKTAAKQMAAHAEIASNNNDLVNDESNKKQSKLVSFMMNDQEIELEIIQGSALESDPFQNVLTIYMVIYSVDNRESFTRAAQILYRLYDHRRNTPLPLILVGNKVDLQRKRKVSYIEGKMLSKIYKCSFVEVSALLSMNMESVWSETLKKLQNNKAEKERLIEKRRRSIMGRLVRQGRLFAKSCEEIIARLYINHL